MNNHDEEVVRDVTEDLLGRLKAIPPATRLRLACRLLEGVEPTEAMAYEGERGWHGTWEGRAAKRCFRAMARAGAAE